MKYTKNLFFIGVFTGMMGWVLYSQLTKELDIIYQLLNLIPVAFIYFCMATFLENRYGEDSKKPKVSYK